MADCEDGNEIINYMIRAEGSRHVWVEIVIH